MSRFDTSVASVNIAALNQLQAEKDARAEARVRNAMSLLATGIGDNKITKKYEAAGKDPYGREALEERVRLHNQWGSPRAKMYGDALDRDSLRAYREGMVAQRERERVAREQAARRDELKLKTITGAESKLVDSVFEENWEGLTGAVTNPEGGSVSATWEWVKDLFGKGQHPNVEDLPSNVQAKVTFRSIYQHLGSQYPTMPQAELLELTKNQFGTWVRGSVGAGGSNDGSEQGGPEKTIPQAALTPTNGTTPSINEEVFDATAGGTSEPAVASPPVTQRGGEAAANSFMEAYRRWRDKKTASNAAWRERMTGYGEGR